MLWIITNDPEVTLPEYDFALFTHFSDTSSYFHNIDKNIEKLRKTLIFYVSQHPYSDERGTRIHYF